MDIVWESGNPWVLIFGNGVFGRLHVVQIQLWQSVADVDERMHYLYLFLSFGNGSPSWLFKASSGLQQGNPPPPFLFTIVTEGSFGGSSGEDQGYWAV